MWAWTDLSGRRRAVATLTVLAALGSIAAARGSTVAGVAALGAAGALLALHLRIGAAATAVAVVALGTGALTATPDGHSAERTPRSTVVLGEQRPPLTTSPSAVTEPEVTEPPVTEPPSTTPPPTTTIAPGRLERWQIVESQSCREAQATLKTRAPLPGSPPALNVQLPDDLRVEGLDADASVFDTADADAEAAPLLRDLPGHNPGRTVVLVDRLAAKYVMATAVDIEDEATAQDAVANLHTRLVCDNDATAFERIGPTGALGADIDVDHMGPTLWAYWSQGSRFVVAIAGSTDGSGGELPQLESLIDAITG